MDKEFKSFCVNRNVLKAWGISLFLLFRLGISLIFVIPQKPWGGIYALAGFFIQTLFSTYVLVCCETNGEDVNE